MAPATLLADFPPAPDTGLFDRSLFERPWLLGGVLLLAAIVIGWSGLRDGLRGRQRMAGVLVLLAAVVLAVGWLVTTPGEHARRVTRAFVDAVVANDLVAADGLLADNATFTFASPENPGFDREFITTGLSELSRRYTIQDNTITLFDSFSRSGQRGTVHLACWTQASGPFAGTAVSQWVIEVTGQQDGTWKIERLIWISINGNAPGRQLVPG